MSKTYPFKHICYDGEEILLSELTMDFLENILRSKKRKWEDYSEYEKEFKKRIDNLTL